MRVRDERDLVRVDVLSEEVDGPNAPIPHWREYNTTLRRTSLVIEVVEDLGLCVPDGAVGHCARSWPAAPRAPGGEIVGGDADAEKRSGMVGARGALGGRDQGFGRDKCRHLRVRRKRHRGQ